MPGQLINISLIDLKKDFVYRIFSFDNFIDLLVSNQICLTHPRLWDDPFENLVISNNDAFKNLKRCFFGQCGSFNKETDFMWRVYAPNKNGIKIKCSLEILYDHLLKLCNEVPQNIYFGKVIYQKKSKMIEDFKNFNIESVTAPNEFKGLVKSFYIKRNEFLPEKEFRIVYYNHKLQFVKGKIEDFYKLSIDKNILIESITCDPRINNSQFNNWKMIFRKMGLKCPIYKSKLYTLEL
jgi:hypothetical protein